jgi:hypothetical protein
MSKLFKGHQRQLAAKRIPHNLAPLPFRPAAKLVEHPIKVLIEPNSDSISHV